MGAFLLYHFLRLRNEFAFYCAPFDGLKSLLSVNPVKTPLKSLSTHCGGNCPVIVRNESGFSQAQLHVCVFDFLSLERRNGITTSMENYVVALDKMVEKSNELEAIHNGVDPVFKGLQVALPRSDTKQKPTEIER